MGDRSADIVILTYKPDDRFIRLSYMLQKQSIKPGRIIVINTEEKYFNMPRDLREGLPGLEVHHISSKEFNHGATRNKGAGYSDSEFLIFMTQDAVPEDEHLLEELQRPMEDSKVAVSYARQLPSGEAGEIERFNRLFNYPDRDILKTKEDIKKLGIKALFCSDVCACYRRSVFDSLGGFVYTDFNEDMIFAYHALMAGYGIYYASRGKVIHSHEYSLMQQFKRNIVLGRSQRRHPEVFGGLVSEGEGKKLVKGCISYLLKKRKPWLIPVFVAHCAARYAGFLIGKHFDHHGE